MRKFLNLVHLPAYLFFLGLTLALVFFTLIILTYTQIIPLKYYPKILKRDFKTIGFLPYWNINHNLKLDYQALDQLIYFSFTPDINGHLMSKVGYGELEPGWNTFYNNLVWQEIKTNAQLNNVKILVSIACFDQEMMYQIVNDPELKNVLIEDIVHLVKTNKLDGIDIDFEYFEQLEHQHFGDKYNQFLSDLNYKLKQINPQLILSTDLYPRSIILGTPYNLKNLSQIVDQIIIMAYDFTQSNSDVAGPVSPLKKGSSEHYDILQTITSAKYQMDLKKLILGIPLYGYEWQTTDDQYRGVKADWGLADTVTYAKAKKLIEEKGLTTFWDATASSPYVIYQEDDLWYQLFYENLYSLELKMSLGLNKKLKGVAFWALGYEGNNSEVWELIRKY